MKVLSYLDCGCAIMEDGHRAFCPTCVGGATVASDVPRGTLTEGYQPQGSAEIPKTVPKLESAVVVPRGTSELTLEAIEWRCCDSERPGRDGSFLIWRRDLDPHSFLMATFLTPNLCRFQGSRIETSCASMRVMRCLWTDPELLVPKELYGN